MAMITGSGVDTAKMLDQFTPDAAGDEPECHGVLRTVGGQRVYLLFNTVVNMWVIVKGDTTAYYLGWDEAVAGMVAMGAKGMMA